MIIDFELIVTQTFIVLKINDLNLFWNNLTWLIHESLAQTQFLNIEICKVSDVKFVNNPSTIINIEEIN